MVSLAVLSVFVTVGLLDSVHFRPRLPSQAAGPRAAYAVDVLSVLDLACESLRTRQEKTYSAPFATELYARETVELADGRQGREYPRLKYGGAHLKDPAAEFGRDIARRGVAGA